MSWMTDWFDELLLKRIAGLLVRRGLDYIGTLLVALPCFGTNLCTNTSEFLAANTEDIVTVSIGLVMLLLSVFLSFKQKKQDVKTIRRGY